VKIAFLIRSLQIGGAERQLVQLAAGLHSEGMNVQVLTFYSEGELRRDLEEKGVPVTDLGKRGRWDIAAFFMRLVSTLRRERPDALYSFLPVANIVAGLSRPLVPSVRIVWGVRASNVDLTQYDRLSRLVFRLECRLSRLADVIIANSRAGRDYHVLNGFPAEKCVVVPNGIDTERFRFDEAGRRRVREEWRIADDHVLIGLAARLDPMKGHPTFIEAAALISERYPYARFVCIGDGPVHYRDELIALASRLNLDGRIVWAKAGDDMPAVWSAFDIATSSSSFGEGFSNAIAEAMACERHCVVTDVGDSARLVCSTGLVVPPRDAQALAKAWQRLMEGDHRKRNEAARRRIVECFSIDRLVADTEAALVNALTGGRTAA
jgi:glycosyltransferase involved in cell wall biosynthesis